MEGEAVTDTPHLQNIFTEYRRQGFQIALDDFGSGYSSMTYLRQFPFDKIKIDRAFIHGLETDPEAQAIVGAILALASGLHMQVTAEGVETESQLEELRARGCGQVQGYLLGLPVPAANLDFSPPRAVDAAPAPARALAANAAD
jgi:EAL domain-containing protein (putative c-di-GMP-specific phosphodiesterase class I)